MTDGNKKQERLDSGKGINDKDGVACNIKCPRRIEPSESLSRGKTPPLVDLRSTGSFFADKGKGLMLLEPSPRAHTKGK